MKSIDQIEKQREWFWNRALEFEAIYDNTNNENHLATAESFAVMVGTLDWVLRDEDAAPLS